MTVAARDREFMRAPTLVPAGMTPSEVNRTPAQITRLLALGRYQSSLRYPGAVSGLSNVIGGLIAAAQFRKVYPVVEAFTGGVSTSLKLVGAGIVEWALLVGTDPIVAAYRQVAASRTQEFIERIADEHAQCVVVGGATASSRWDYWRARTATPGTGRSTRTQSSEHRMQVQPQELE